MVSSITRSLRLLPRTFAARWRALARMAAVTLSLAACTLASPASCAEEEASSSEAAAARAGLAQVPADLREMQDWLDAKAKDEAAMPIEARLACRRGMIAWRSGEEAKAVSLLRGASALDPSYAAPPLTLTGWFLFREPSQALQSGAEVLERVRADFRLQLELIGNLLFFAIQGLFFGLLAASLILVGRHQRELRHMWCERLGIVLSDRSATLWSWGFLLLPWVLGFGFVVPTLVMFAMLWPLLRPRERAVFVGLVMVVVVLPFTPSLMGRLAQPLRTDQPPFYDIYELENAPYTSARHAEVAHLAHQHPDNPFLAFGLAWTARRGGDLAGAEKAYRDALERWPNNDRIMNNLGNLLAMQGRFDDALVLYGEATKHQARNAAAYFNSSQVYVRRFDYRAASDAVAKASAIDFDMVRTYQARTGNELPLVDQWLSPGLFWQVLFETSDSAIFPALPPGWRRMLEMSGWRFTGVALGLTLLALLVGLWWHRKMPVRTCSNCGAPVCRRCAHRQRELALCRACAAIAARAETPEFGRVLLLQQKRKAERVRAILSTTLATLVPGLGLVASRRIFYAIGLLMITSLLTTTSLMVRAPFPLGQELLDSQGAATGAAVAWLILYLLSIVGFLGRKPEAEVTPKPGAGRIVVPEPPARAA
jgi:tetratricopeptide (TPR) repeat protein